jgi:hypothetical protein
MAQSRQPRRKQRTREHIIADLSVNHTEKQALLCGYTVEKRIHDYGIDLVLLTYSDVGEVENGEVLFQVKATDRPAMVKNGRFIICRIEYADLWAWLLEPFPVILIMYDAPNDRAFWLYFQSEFSDPKAIPKVGKSERITIRIPTNQLLNQDAVRHFRDFRNSILQQIRGIVHGNE